MKEEDLISIEIGFAVMVASFFSVLDIAREIVVKNERSIYEGGFAVATFILFFIGLALILYKNKQLSYQENDIMKSFVILKQRLVNFFKYNGFWILLVIISLVVFSLIFYDIYQQKSITISSVGFSFLLAFGIAWLNRAYNILEKVFDGKNHSRGEGIVFIIASIILFIVIKVVL